MSKRVSNARGTHGASKNRGPTRKKLNRDIQKALAERRNQEAIKREAMVVAARKKTEKKKSKPWIMPKVREFFSRTFNKGARGR